MTEQRLIDIETKIVYQEDTIAQLNDVIYKQQNQIDALELLTQQLLVRVKDLSESVSASPISVFGDNERPPHY